MTSPSKLEISRRGDDELVLAGVIDLRTAPGLSKLLEERGTDDDVVVDLGDVEFIDSSGLRAIVLAHHDLRAADHRLRLTNISPAVERVLDITGLREQLDLL